MLIFNNFNFTKYSFVNEQKISRHFKQDVFVKHNAPDNGQFQRRPISQGQIF